MRLRLDEGRGRLVLTHPRRMSRRSALAWAEQQREWAKSQIATVAPVIPFEPGSVIPIEGEDLVIRWDPSAPRRPQRIGGALLCGGPIESLPGRLERFLKELARQRAIERTAAVADRAGISVSKVSIGDTRSRWGSCSASGAIRYNWRLIMAPPDVFDWVVAHEVAHRRHMNHGPQFKALEAALFDGDVASARLRLRALGARLKRIGRPV
ncbi:M48 family metallopeptidase [Sphingomonas jaspsi]|uniref:M48 family metallopeptidase n=1 Tax=Sphingomonas jaspsi TaxID=392409 RepID=UPI00146F97A1|nr:SprT family zinc-dependent metalloprotease [Sphingomonas jaspsi]